MLSEVATIPTMMYQISMILKVKKTFLIPKPCQAPFTECLLWGLVFGAGVPGQGV
jgi:hypothetical protein